MWVLLIAIVLSLAAAAYVAFRAAALEPADVLRYE
jgi:ABC-type lipoprotein release transport system permease subunit